MRYYLWQPSISKDVCNPETCMHVSLCAEAKQDLMSYVVSVRDLISDPERNLTKEEKVTLFFIRIQQVIYTQVKDYLLMEPF